METSKWSRNGFGGLLVCGVAGIWWLGAGWAWGQVRTAAAPAAATAPGVPLQTSATERAPSAQVIDVEADSLSYDAVRHLVVADGNVRVTKGLDSLEGDYAEVDTENETVYAKGNLRLQYQGNAWQGNETHFNFRTGVGDFGAFTLRREPFTIIARDSQRVDDRRMSLSGVILTTCDPENPEYSVRAAYASLEDDSIIRAKHVRFQLGPVPFFYFPYIKANVHWFDNFEFTPGVSSSMGVFLLTAYRHRINETWTSRTHLDLREKRGVGLGQDVLWDDPEGLFSGMARVYYVNDQEPWKNETQQAERENLVDADRYWFHFEDRHNLTDRDSLRTELNYVSDPWILNDFFDEVYQQNVQPENRVTLSHRGNRYTAGIGLVARLNDFYSNVSRLPEAYLTVNRQQILQTPLYYESENTMSFLRKEYADGSTAEDYDAYRLDTYHTVYWPSRQFGFLSLVPRAGYRGTYYSKTRESSAVTNVVPVTDAETGLVVGTTNQVETLLSDGEAVWRSLPEIGLESSFSAFGTLMDGATGIEEDQGLRHVAEPYLDYTLRLEPNAEPEDLWYFDSIDELDKAHEVLLGMRNYLQTKRQGRLHNLAYLDVYGTLNLDPDDEAGEEAFENLSLKAELMPFTPFYWNFQAVYDVQESLLYTFDTQVGLEAENVFSFGVDYRYKDEVRDLLAVDVSLFPEQRWEGRVYARMDLKESQLEEHSYYLIHRTQCLGVGVGLRIRPEYGKEEEDDYSVWFRIWPLAFPEFFSDIGN